METASAFVKLKHVEVWTTLTTKNEPTQPEWDDAFHQILEWKRSKNGDLSRLRVVSISDGGRPNAEQNAYLNKTIFGGQPVKMSVLTIALSSPFLRGLANLFSLANSGLKVFDPSDAHRAMAHVGVEREAWEVYRQLERLQSKMAPNASLSLFHAGLKKPSPAL